MNGILFTVSRRRAHYPVNGVKVEGGLLIYFLVHIAYKLLMCDTMNFPINLLNHDLASVLEIW